MSNLQGHPNVPAVAGRKYQNPPKADPTPGSEEADVAQGEKFWVEAAISFYDKFGKQVGVDQLQRLVGLPGVRPWYQAFRDEWIAQESIPEAWKEVGLTASMWALAQHERRESRRYAVERDISIAEEKARLDAMLADHVRRLDAKAPPHSFVTKVVEAGYLELPLESQIAVEAETGEKRKLVLEAELKAQRKKWVDKLRVDPARDPFRGA